MQKWAETVGDIFVSEIKLGLLSVCVNRFVYIIRSNELLGQLCLDSRPLVI
jgi:hypothetical protein